MSEQNISDHNIKVRVYYEDTDFSGVVYHANYLKFLERGRTEALRALGATHAELLDQEDPIVFTVRHLSLSYKAPARIDDLLIVRTRFTAAKGARLFVAQSIWRDETCLTEAEVEVAAMALSGRPRRLPPSLLALLQVANS